jgi:hypothetical protein
MLGRVKAKEDAFAPYVAATRAVHEISGERMLSGGADRVLALHVVEVETRNSEMQLVAIWPAQNTGAGRLEIARPTDVAAGMAEAELSISPEQANQS